MMSEQHPPPLWKNKPVDVLMFLLYDIVIYRNQFYLKKKKQKFINNMQNDIRINHK